MDDLTALQELAQDPRAWVSDRANMAIMLYEQYQGGGVDDFEYQEMMQRVIASKELDQQADDLDTKATLITAVLGAGNCI